ncbi:hypothetical protein V8E36_008967 [Tilletia maclaganii]
MTRNRRRAALRAAAAAEKDEDPVVPKLRKPKQYEQSTDHRPCGRKRKKLRARRQRGLHNTFRQRAIAALTDIYDAHCRREAARETARATRQDAQTRNPYVDDQVEVEDEEGGSGDEAEGDHGDADIYGNLEGLIVPDVAASDLETAAHMRTLELPPGASAKALVDRMKSRSGSQRNHHTMDAIRHFARLIKSDVPTVMQNVLPTSAKKKKQRRSKQRSYLQPHAEDSATWPLWFKDLVAKDPQMSLDRRRRILAVYD